MKTRKRYMAATTMVATFVMVAAATGQASGASGRTAVTSLSPLTIATANAETLVAGHPDVIMASAGETYAHSDAIASNGLTYVPYERTYQGLPVAGGDFVVVADSAGKVVFTSVAQESRIGDIKTTPEISVATAEQVAGKELSKVESVEGARLVVSMLTGTARLAWQTTVTGTGAEGYSRADRHGRREQRRGSRQGRARHERYGQRQLGRQRHHHDPGQWQHLLHVQPNHQQHAMPERIGQHDVHRTG